jgi:hypothetical protein
MSKSPGYPFLILFHRFYSSIGALHTLRYGAMAMSVAWCNATTTIGFEGRIWGANDCRFGDELGQRYVNDRAEEEGREPSGAKVCSTQQIGRTWAFGGRLLCRSARIWCSVISMSVSNVDGVVFVHCGFRHPFRSILRAESRRYWADGFVCSPEVYTPTQMLAYGGVGHGTYEYCRLGESTTSEAIKRFVRAMHSCFKLQYLQ